VITPSIVVIPSAPAVIADAAIAPSPWMAIPTLKPRPRADKHAVIEPV
jgi:hypothetical protein